jgi:hypothetical protein
MVETKELNENQISCFKKVCDYLNIWYDINGFRR